MKIKDSVKIAIKLWGIVYTLGMSIILYVTFLIIFSTQDKIALISVNRYGEGTIEFVTIPIALLFAGVGQVMMVKELIQVDPSTE
ncbi:MAG: hypothetical protein SVM80_12145 [Halobacteriota archaeon]|nr:hypothetical protein [Halobacteriota archaeon]